VVGEKGGETAYTPKLQGYRYRQLLAEARALCHRQREIVGDVVERGADRAELYQALTAIVLLSSKVEDVLDGLARLRDGPPNEKAGAEASTPSGGGPST
jgi:hypothetical protein